MTVGAISSGAAVGRLDSIGASDRAALTQNAASGTRDHEFARSYAAVANASASEPSHAAPALEPQREINHSATRNHSLGERILDRLEAIHRGDKLSDGSESNTTSGPLVKVASAEPGPAARALRELPGSPDLKTRAHGDPDQFKSMLEQLQQAYGQVIQVSIVSKSSGSFTSSMNRLMSSS